MQFATLVSTQLSITSTAFLLNPKRRLRLEQKMQDFSANAQNDGRSAEVAILKPIISLKNMPYTYFNVRC